MRSTLLIAFKDVVRSIRDRSFVLTAVVAPLGLAFVLNSVLGGSGDFDSFNVTFGVVNEDRGDVAEGFLEVLGDVDGQGFADVEEIDTVDEARGRLNDDAVGAVFVIPEGFSDAARGVVPANLQVIENPDAPFSAEIARSIAERFGNGVNAVRLAAATVDSFGAEYDPADVEAAAMSPVTVAEDDVGSKQFSGGTFYAAGMAIFFLFLTTQMGAVSILQERREGTMARLLAAPIARPSIVAGKALYSFVVGIASLTVLIIATTVLLGAEWGDPAGVALLVVSGTFAALGVQSLGAIVAKTDEQAAAYGSMVAVTLGLLGGTFFPLSQGPSFLSTISLVTPHQWMMRGFGSLSGGAARAGDVLQPAAALLTFGIVFGSIALWRARRMVIHS